MRNQDKTKQQLLNEIEELKLRLNKLETASISTLSNEEKIISLEKIMQYIAENSIDAIAMAQDRKIIFANDAYCKIFGYTEEEVIGQNMLVVVAPEDRALIEENASKRLKGEEVPCRYAFNGIRKDGTRLTIEFSARESFIFNSKPTIMAIMKDATETKRLQEALQESEEFHKSLIASMPDAVVVTDLQGRILYVSPKVLEFLKTNNPEEVLGKDGFEFIAPEQHDQAAANLQIILKQGQLKNMELSCLHKDGSRFLIEINASIIKDNYGKPKAIIGTARDITEKKKAEQALQESEEKFRTLAEQSPNMIFINKNGKVVYANEKCSELMKYTKEEFYSPEFDYLCLFTPESAEARKSSSPFQPNGQSSKYYEDVLITKDGKKINVLLNLKPVNYGGEKALLGIATDITEPKHFEAALLETQEMYKSLIHALPDPIAVTDPEGRILFASQQALESLGLESMNELIGRNSFDFIAPEDHKKAILALQKTLQEGFASKVELTFMKKDGNHFIAEATSSLIRNSEGKPKSFITILHVITDRKLMEVALRESEKKYRSLVDSALIGVYKTNINGDYLYANPALAKIFEFDSPEEMATQKVFARYKNPQDRLLFIESAKKTGTLDNYEIELLTKYGDPKPVLMSAILDGDVLSGMILDITERKKAETELKENFEKLEKVMESTIYSIARIVETRDPYTAGHQQRVAALVLTLAKELHLAADEIKGLHMASVIHDIGKIYVPSEILSRPTKLTDTEFALIKTHPEVGFEILKHIDFPWKVAEIVFQHHERLNGSGYPQGLKANEILFEAKILAVADVVEAMSSHRPYRPSRGLKATLNELDMNKGILYDVRVVDVCIDVFVKKSFKFP